MRNGQNKRMRGRNQHHGHGHGHNNHGHRKSHNPMSRVYESNGPDVKIRGNPAHIAEKYIQLARDAQASGDPISAENYYQHAEHYYRLIAAAQEQFRQNNPHLARAENDGPGGPREEVMDDDDGEQQPMMGDSPFGMREPQPYLPRDAQPFPQQQQPPAPQQQAHTPRQHQPAQEVGGDIDRLPSFITGGQQPQAQQTPPGYQGFAQNGHDAQAQGDRFPLHRRRRRHRGPRNDFQGGSRNDDRDDNPRNE